MIAGILSAAVSGLSVNAQRVGASADNIVNVSTTGYKRTDLQTKSIATVSNATAYAPGGVQAVSRTLSTVPGLLASSTSSTDLAIAGSGYFAVSKAPGGGETFFTRDGDFAPDAQGDLVNGSGHYLLATASDGQTLQPVNAARIGGTAQATSHIAVDANLPATADAGEAFSIHARATDSLGGNLDIQLNFEAQGGGDYRVTVASVTETSSGVSGVVAREGDSAGPAYDVNVNFSGDGLVAGFDGEPSPPVLNISGLTSGADDLNIELDFGRVGGANGLTKFGSDFLVGGVQADGAQFGGVSGLDISQNGTISALFDNGQTRTVANIAVATFTNPVGLEVLSGGIYRATDGSGPPTFRTPGSGGAGSVQSGALELSSTDLGTEFSNLILAQNAYSASLSVLKAADELTQGLLDEFA